MPIPPTHPAVIQQDSIIENPPDLPTISPLEAAVLQMSLGLRLLRLRLVTALIAKSGKDTKTTLMRPSLPRVCKGTFAMALRWKKPLTRLENEPRRPKNLLHLQPPSHRLE